MSAGKTSRLQKLLTWYRALVKPFLVRAESEKVKEFDRDSERLESREQRLDEELAICFLGNSGVGKSTLINALVAGKEILLPAGGVGPLTAQALTVRHSERVRFEVQYHSPRNLWQLVFALEQIHKKDSALLQTDNDVEAPENLLDAEAIEEIRRDLELPEDADVAAQEEQKERREQLKKQAQLMVKGNQDSTADLPYLIDILRSVGGWKTAWGTQVLEEDRDRLKRLQTALELVKKNQVYVQECNDHAACFSDELKAHASGFLAPLIKELQVFWDSPLLKQGLAVIDLPGIGIAGDVHRAITSKWIREKARAVVLVVDHRGITQPSADLLYKSGFLNSLLYTSDDPADDPILIVAVVKVDDITDERYAADKSRKRKKAAHFEDVCAETKTKIKAQLRAQLEKTWSPDAMEGSDQRVKVLNNIMNTLQIHPVSAIQYRRILEKDEDDPPFLAMPEQTKIPQFITALDELVRARRQRIAQSLGKATDNFFLQVNGALNIIHAQWNEGNRAQEETDRLREDLMKFIKPKQKEFYSRQGAFREFLKNTVPQRIEALVKDASRKAEKDIQRYLNGLREAHWNTLKASVRRGGTYSGARHIDLPMDFALRFEEPIAEIWATKLLKEIRLTTKNFTDDCVSLVEEVASWAKDQGTRVSGAIIEAKRQAIKADSEKLTTVGKEMVEEMRESVKTSLIKSIESPIRKKCAAFIKKEDDVGTGVKARILELFRELAEDVVIAAAEPAATLLKNNFTLVEEEIRSVLKQYDDPLLSAANEIVASHESRIRRSDGQKRKAVTEEIKAIWQNIPPSFLPSKSSRVLQ